MKNIYDIKKEIPFKVPDTYFEEFQTVMADKLMQNQSGSHLKLWMKPAVAAAILFLFFSVIALKVFVFNDSHKIEKPQLTENSYIETHVDENIIVNEIVNDSTNLENKKSGAVKDSDDDVDYLAETVDYNTLLAEL